MTNPNYKKYALKVTVKTPVHIGNGRILQSGYDHSIFDNQTWRIDENALLTKLNVENAAEAEIIAHQKPTVFLEADKGHYMDESPFFLYRLPGTPLSSDKSIREQIKNSFFLPYIPGSTLKGALRSALGWYAVQQKQYRPDVEKIKDRHGRYKKKEFSGQEFDKDIFGRRPWDADGSDPNYDLMRALQIGDSAPMPRTSLMLVNAAVVRRSNREPDKITSLEALAVGTEIRMELKIDLQLFSRWATERGFHLANGDSNAQSWLTNFVEIARTYARQRIQEELRYFNSCSTEQTATAKRIYEDFQNSETHLEKNEFWIQLGWGIGWNGKTLGSNLRTSTELMKTIMREYRLSRNHPETTPDEYPLTRRLIYTEQRKLTVPFGWVLVEVNEL